MSVSDRIYTTVQGAKEEKPGQTKKKIDSELSELNSANYSLGKLTPAARHLRPCKTGQVLGNNSLVSASTGKWWIDVVGIGDFGPLRFQKLTTS